MSSSPTEAAPVRRRKLPARKRRKLGGLIKWMLPRTLFGRSILILVTPLILVQGVTIKVFNDRLWDTVVRRLSNGVAGEIALTLEARAPLAGSFREHTLLAEAGLSTELHFTVLPGSKASRSAAAAERHGRRRAACRRPGRARPPALPDRRQREPGMGRARSWSRSSCRTASCA
ncbi:MAG: hypothetical protein WDN69_37150 [Aliidongia sp.]